MRRFVLGTGFPAVPWCQQQLDFPSLLVFLLHLSCYPGSAFICKTCPLTGTETDKAGFLMSLLHFGPSRSK